MNFYRIWLKRVLIAIVFISALFLKTHGLTSFPWVSNGYAGNATGEGNGSSSSDLCERFDLDPSIPKLTCSDKQYLIDLAYNTVSAHLGGGVHSISYPAGYNGISNKVFVSFNINGRKRGSWSAKTENIAESVHRATLRTLADKRYGNAITVKDLDDLKIEIFVLGDEKPLKNLGDYEPGIHGVRLHNGSRQATYYNSVAIEGNYRLNKLLSKLCKKARLSRKCFFQPGTEKFTFHTLHFATTRFSKGITTFYRCNTVSCRPESAFVRVKPARDLAVSWMLNNITKEGGFKYLYEPARGKYPHKNNMIRFWMSARTLAGLSGQDARLRPLHMKNMAFGLGQWYREKENVGHISFDNKSKVGANGMAVLAMTSSPFYKKYADKAVKLARSILSVQGEDGSLKAFFVEPGYVYNEQRLLTYYSGEAILGLIALFEKSNNKKFLNAAVKSQDYFLKRYVDEMEKYFFPAYVPWHTMSLYRLYRITGDEKYVQAIFILNDALIRMQDTKGSPYPDYLGRFYDPSHPEYGRPFSGSTAIYVEGLAYAYALARERGDSERLRNYKKSIRLGCHNLMNLQYKGSNMYYLSHPERVKGAIRYRVDDNRIRIDTTQHAIDAFTKVLEVFGATEKGIK